MKNAFLTVFVLLSFPFSAFSAQSGGTCCEEAVSEESLYIKSLDAFHFESRLDPPILKIQFTIHNKSYRSMRIRDGNVSVFFNPRESDYKNSGNGGGSVLNQMDTDLITSDRENLNKKLYIGEARIGCGKLPASVNIATDAEYIEIPSRSSTTKIIEIHLPVSIEDRIRTIWLLMNYLGFPKSCKSILLEGTATVGQNDSKGWSYHRNMPINLVLCPKTEHMEKNGILF